MLESDVESSQNPSYVITIGLMILLAVSMLLIALMVILTLVRRRPTGFFFSSQFVDFFLPAGVVRSFSCGCAASMSR